MNSLTAGSSHGLPVITPCLFCAKGQYTVTDFGSLDSTGPRSRGRRWEAYTSHAGSILQAIAYHWEPPRTALRGRRLMDTNDAIERILNFIRDLLLEGGLVAQARHWIPLCWLWRMEPTPPVPLCHVRDARKVLRA